MIDAKQARAKTQNVLSVAVEVLLSRIMLKIEDSAGKGHSHVTYPTADTPVEVIRQVAKDLKDLGFVAYTSPNYDTLKISW